MPESENCKGKTQLYVGVFLAIVKTFPETVQINPAGIDEQLPPEIPN